MTTEKLAGLIANFTLATATLLNGWAPLRNETVFFNNAITALTTELVTFTTELVTLTIELVTFANTRLTLTYTLRKRPT